MQLRGLVDLYSWFLPRRLATELQAHDYSVKSYLQWFWLAKRYEPSDAKLPIGAKILQAVALLGSLAQIVVGVWLLVLWARNGTPGDWQFGFALLLSYPVVWAHVLALITSISWLVYFLAHPKKLGRAIVCSALEYQVKQLRKRHKFTVVAVAGSVGKTSTKLAIASLLSVQHRVRHQMGNYNDRVTVPLIFFGVDEPNILNMFAWFRIFRSNSGVIRGNYPYDVVVVELGTDCPGQLKKFAYIQPELAVVSAVAPEHMEYFKTLDAVAAEELTVFDFAKQVLVNGDDITGEYLAGGTFLEYSTASKQANYFASSTDKGLKGQTLHITLPKSAVAADTAYIGQQGAKIALAAAAVGDILGMKPAEIKKGVQALQPFSGRMQILAGIKSSTIIDDTYNASPLAVIAALDVLYNTKAPQRIALLGNMNELGGYSKEAHQEIGEYCDPKKLDLVLTLGVDANKYLVPAAKKRGCKVKTFTSPYEVAEFVKNELKTGAIVLAKGSQNGVFAEEAVKLLLADVSDANKLVRQSSSWLAVKQKQFNG